MIRWEWDAAKAAANLRKHGISFEIATQVFGDPYNLFDVDDHPDDDRSWIIGRPVGASRLLLYVVYTDPRALADEDIVRLILDGVRRSSTAGPAWSGRLNGEEVGRIISARRSTKHEARRYEEG